MAVNPITSESLTVDFKRLMSIPVGDRVRAASVDQNFVQSILTALTPIQIAKAFPDYFRRQLPDISNFVTSNIVARNGGMFNQTGGGDGGSAYPYYDGPNQPTGKRPAGVPAPTIEEMKEKLLKKGIDVDGTLNLVKQGAVLESDERMSSIKNMTDEQLKSVGMQRIQDENGKTLIQMAPSVYEGMSEAQILEQYKKEFPKSNISPRERATLDLIAKREGSKDPNTIFGGERYVERLGLDKKPLTERTVSEVINDIMPRLRELSKADGYGINERGELKGTSAVGTGQMIEGTLKDNLRALGIPEKDWDKIKFDKDLQERLTLMNFKTSGIGDPNADPSTWNQTRLGAQYESFNTSRDKAPLTGEEAMQVREKSPVRPENKEDVTAQQALAKLQEAESVSYGEELIRRLYNAPSPTSSESAIVSGQTIVTESQSEVARVRKDPITPELKEVLQYAGEESGVEVQVFSGGQADITQGGDRTGSERHDLGHAADITLRVRDEAGNFRTLDSRNPQDQEIMANFIKNARRMGAKGIGHGLDYMGASAIHVGTVDRPDIDYSKSEYGAPAGKEAVWRSPDWVTNAFHQGQKEAEDFDMKAYREAREQRLQTQQAQLEQPVPQKLLGGNIYGVNEDITLVNTKTGEPIAQVNDNERIEKQGNAIQVTPETKLKADELTQKYDTSSEIEDRMNNIENRVDQQQEISTQNIRKATAPEKVQTESPMKWREAVAAGERPVSPSFNRAMARTKFFPEGHHFNRSSPSSQS